LFGEVELRIVSAAAAVSWELRFLFAVARRTQGAASVRRTRPGAKVRRLTSRSPSEATAGVSDDRFAGTRPGTGTVGRHRGRCRRCRRGSGWRVSSRVTSRSLTPSPRGDVRWAFEPFAEPGRWRRPSDWHPCPLDSQRPGRSPERDPPPRPFGA